TGSFISTDSILEPYDPQDLDGYAYAIDNPATYSDPTGDAAQQLNTYYDTCLPGDPAYNAPYNLSGSCGSGGFVSSALQDAVTLDLEANTASSVEDALELFAMDPGGCN